MLNGLAAFFHELFILNSHIQTSLWAICFFALPKGDFDKSIHKMRKQNTLVAYPECLKF